MVFPKEVYAFESRLYNSSALVQFPAAASYLERPTMDRAIDLDNCIAAPATAYLAPSPALQQHHRGILAMQSVATRPSDSPTRASAFKSSPQYIELQNRARAASNAHEKAAKVQIIEENKKVKAAAAAARPRPSLAKPSSSELHIHSSPQPASADLASSSSTSWKTLRIMPSMATFVPASYTKAEIEENQLKLDDFFLTPACYPVCQRHTEILDDDAAANPAVMQVVNGFLKESAKWKLTGERDVDTASMADTVRDQRMSADLERGEAPLSTTTTCVGISSAGPVIQPFHIERPRKTRKCLPGRDSPLSWVTFSILIFIGIILFSGLSIFVLFLIKGPTFSVHCAEGDYTCSNGFDPRLHRPGYVDSRQFHDVDVDVAVSSTQTEGFKFMKEKEKKEKHLDPAQLEEFKMLKKMDEFLKDVLTAQDKASSELDEIELLI